MKKIPFNIPLVVGTEEKYLIEAISNRKFAGDGQFTKKCNLWFEEKFNVPRVLLTTSCTHALEMAAILLNIKAGDEVIMPSYTFVSTANAFVLRGAKIIFVDIRPDTMNIDESKIEQAISSKTIAIVPVHYAGVACEMDTIMSIAKKHSLYVVEDAAQALMSTYKGTPLGTIGDIGCYSFHETKNYNCGEGGAILINNKKFIQRSEIIREKGTNRSQFFRGMVDKYSWVDIGSSYLMNDVSASYLWGQSETHTIINNNRLESWNLYFNGLKKLEEDNIISLPSIPIDCVHNGHMFYIKVENFKERTILLKYLNKNNINVVFHYIPLHSSDAGLRFSRFDGIDSHTTEESSKLIRLPLYYNLKKSDIDYVIRTIKQFFENK